MSLSEKTFEFTISISLNRRHLVTLASLPVIYVLFRALTRRLDHPRKRRARTKVIPKNQERVLVLGASSGIGKAIAYHYNVERDARVLAVGRRHGLVQNLVEICHASRSEKGLPLNGDLVGFVGDFTNPEDMVRLRDKIIELWGGLDTLVVAAGVSALQPLLAVAGADVEGSELTQSQTTTEGIQRSKDVALAAINGNYVGPVVAATTFIPLLSATSKSPSIVLISSLASVIPAPTRSIYGSTKSASLILYQSLSIEHPQIAFSHILPSTVEGDFRASAVDAGPVRENDPNKHGLKVTDVAKRCIKAADETEGMVFMPWTMKFSPLLYWIAPRFIERMAAKKYNFEP